MAVSEIASSQTPRNDRSTFMPEEKPTTEAREQIFPDTGAPHPHTGILVFLFAILAFIALSMAFFWWESQQELVEGEVDSSKAQEMEAEKRYQEGLKAASSYIDPDDLDIEVDTSDWQTYRNEEFGFEVRNPNGWFSLSGEQLDPATGERLAYRLAFAPSPSAFKHVVVNGELTPLTFGWNDLDIYIEERSFEEEEINIFESQNCSVVTWNGTKASRCSRADQSLIQFDREGRRWIISWPNSHPTNPPETQQEFTERDQILSTFRFIEDEVDTSDWTTYRNEEFGFEFLYPAEWSAVTDGGRITLMSNIQGAGEEEFARLIFQIVDDTGRFESSRVAKECSYENALAGYDADSIVYSSDPDLFVICSNLDQEFEFQIYNTILSTLRFLDDGFDYFNISFVPKRDFSSEEYEAVYSYAEPALHARELFQNNTPEGFTMYFNEIDGSPYAGYEPDQPYSSTYKTLRYAKARSGELAVGDRFEDDFAYLSVDSPIVKSVVPFLSNDRYCNVHSDCSYRTSGCRSGSFNNYQHYIGVYGCSEALYDNGQYSTEVEKQLQCSAGQYLDYQYSSEPLCIENRCTGEDLSFVCKDFE